MTKKQAYKALSDANIHWDRKDAKTIWVATSGFITEDAFRIQKFLEQAKMKMIDQKFDKTSGKTFSYYRHK